jgi:hypothetical protein
LSKKSFISEDANSREIVNTAEQYLRKTLIEMYSEFIRNEDQKVGSSFQQLANESNGKVNALIGDIQQKAAQLFGFQVINLNFNVSLNFETKFYYHLDPIFLTGITFSGGEIAEYLPKSLFKSVLKKKLHARARSEFDKNGGRIRYDYFITRINQAVLKQKKDIDQALNASTEIVKHAVSEAERLQTENKLKVNSRLGELRKMQVDLESIRKQLDYATL